MQLVVLFNLSQHVLLFSGGFECVQHLSSAEKDANHPKTSERKLQDQNKTEISFEQMKEIRTENQLYPCLAL